MDNVDPVSSPREKEIGRKKVTEEERIAERKCLGEKNDYAFLFEQNFLQTLLRYDIRWIIVSNNFLLRLLSKIRIRL